MKISSLKLPGRLFLAPMAGITNLPYRMTCKSFGAALVYSEMISANGLIRNGAGSLDLLASDPAERPLAVQLFGDDPEVMATAAKRVENRADLLDLNLGCPVNKVVRSGAGSALLRNPHHTARLLAKVRAAVTKPLSIKIRSGWDHESVNFLEIGRIAEAEGVDAITLHPRTRSQGFTGQAVWEHIGELKSALSIPVIGSGDLFEASDCLKMFTETGCDAVMIGRGSYGRPWIFREAALLMQGRVPSPISPQDRLRVILDHMESHRRACGEQKTLFDMRKNLCWYARGLPLASEFRRLVNQTTCYESLKELTNAFFAAADIREAS